MVTDTTPSAYLVQLDQFNWKSLHGCILQKVISVSLNIHIYANNILKMWKIHLWFIFLCVFRWLSHMQFLTNVGLRVVLFTSFNLLCWIVFFLDEAEKSHGCLKAQSIYKPVIIVDQRILVIPGKAFSPDPPIYNILQCQWIHCAALSMGVTAYLDVYRDQCDYTSCQNVQCVLICGEINK